jgi:HlyD family secretion protein
MKAELFRKPQERLASPEELNQTIRVTGPIYWTTLAGMAISAAVLGAWSYTGSIPTKAVGDGVVIRPGGIFNVTTPASGYVQSFDIKVGDHVERGQVVAHLAQPESDEQIRAAEFHLTELRADAANAQALRESGVRAQVESLRAQRENTEREIRAQQEAAKVAADELANSQQLYAKGLIARQPVIDADLRLSTINAAIGRLQSEIAHVLSQETQLKIQPEELRGQRATEIRAQEVRIESMRRNYRITSTVVSPMAGDVVEEKVYPGMRAAAGSPVLSLQPASDELVAVVYIPSNQAKDVKVGMEAEISPSTAKREEFGFIRGTVVYVAAYPATTSGMMMLFENDTLVSSLRGRGMLTEAHIAMRRSATTPSGFEWSSSRGPETHLLPGAICSVQIVTRSQKPIELVFPFLKKLVGAH